MMQLQRYVTNIHCHAFHDARRVVLTTSLVPRRMEKESLNRKSKDVSNKLTELVTEELQRVKEGKGTAAAAGIARR